MKKETSAGIIIYRRTKEGIRFLLLYHGGDYWNFPKGHIEDVMMSDEADGEHLVRETSLNAALREVEEETGLRKEDVRVENGFRAYEAFTFFQNDMKIAKTVIFYLAETNKAKITIAPPQNGYEEHYGWGWFLYKDAMRIMHKYKDGEAALEKAYDFIIVPHIRNMERQAIIQKSFESHRSPNGQRMDTPRPAKWQSPRKKW
jgi:8-oxo-dGTP pyrophosphatase MutT (NUDIX family)